MKTQLRIGIYAGSFNPFHVGHLSILEQAEKIFDKVIIAVGNNPKKQFVADTAFLSNLQNALRYRSGNQFINREVELYKGLLTKYIKSKGENCTLIRGIRNGTDLEYERTQLAYMKRMYPELQIIYIPCDPIYQHLSSSGIKDLMTLDEEEANSYLIK